MFCSNCGNENSEDSKFCFKCGKPLQKIEIIRSNDSGVKPFYTGETNPQTQSHIQGIEPPKASQQHVINIIQQVQPPTVAGVTLNPKSPSLALLLSFFIVGLGQIYNGQLGKGILMFFGCIFLWFFYLGWIVNIWSIIDAYQYSKKYNHVILAGGHSQQPSAQIINR